MYKDATTSVKFKNSESTAFDVKVGVHQGSMLSPLLFISVRHIVYGISVLGYLGSYCMQMT